MQPTTPKTIDLVVAIKKARWHEAEKGLEAQKRPKPIPGRPGEFRMEAEWASVEDALVDAVNDRLNQLAPPGIDPTIEAEAEALRVRLKASQRGIASFEKKEL